MNIERLKERLKEKDIFTYKELCEILEEKYNGGTAKTKQLEDWNRYFEYSKEGTKLKIALIREKPLPDIDKTLNGSKYYSDLETLIMYALQDSASLRLSVNQVLKFTNMVNQNYFTTLGNEVSFCELCNVDIDFLYAFRQLSRKKVKEIFERTLNKMRSKALINYNKTMMVCVEEVLDTYTINKDGDVKQDVIRTFRRATDEEIKLITDAEKESLSFVGCKDKPTCISSGLWNKYSEKLLSILGETTDGIIFFYYAYEIFSHENIVRREIAFFEQQQAKDSLNDKMCDSVLTSKSKTVNDSELRTKLVNILLDKDTTTNIRKILLKIKEIHDTTDYDVFMD